MPLTLEHLDSRPEIIAISVRRTGIDISAVNETDLAPLAGLDQPFHAFESTNGLGKLAMKFAAEFSKDPMGCYLRFVAIERKTQSNAEELERLARSAFLVRRGR